MTSSAPRVIFLLGIRPRSGTNYLGMLLSRHPDCGTVEGLWEDQIVRELAQLEGYVQRISGQWPEHARDDLARELRLGLGRGIASMLTELGSAPFVRTKTPSVAGVDRVRSFFPDAAILFLIRDGRAVAESARRTFGRGATLETEAQAWAEGARTIRRFMDEDPGPHALVRYEDLVLDTAGELRRLFSVFGMDPDPYDWDTLDDVPVKGSSTYHGEGESTTHWKQIPKDRDFNPLARAAAWPESKHRRFDAFAGPEMELFGYERPEGSASPLTALAHRLANGLDRLVRWSRAVEIRAGTFWRRVRRRIRGRTA